MVGGFSSHVEVLITASAQCLDQSQRRRNQDTSRSNRSLQKTYYRGGFSSVTGVIVYRSRHSGGTAASAVCIVTCTAAVSGVRSPTPFSTCTPIFALL